jgi:hypothetical protein
MRAQEKTVTMPVGFDTEIAQAAHHRVVLFTGPKGIGKRTTCEYLAATSGAVGFEQVKIDRLDMDSARHIIERCRTRPIKGIRAIALNVEAVSSGAANALLKTLEEGPEHTRFYLHTSRPVLPTIRSRAVTFHHGVLSDDQVYQVCRAHGMDDEAAYVAARAAHGIPARALEALTKIANRHVVIELLRAVHDGDQDLLSSATGSLDREGLDLLRTWAHEAYTNQWAYFSPGETYGLEDDRKFVARVRYLSQRAGSPRLVARAALWVPTEQRAGRVSV